MGGGLVVSALSYQGVAGFARARTVRALAQLLRQRAPDSRFNILINQVVNISLLGSTATLGLG